MANLREKLQEDLRTALRQRDVLRRSVIRLIMAGVVNGDIAQGSPLDDSGILGVIAKEARQRKESIEAFRQGNRQDLVSQEEAELGVLMEYLPRQMSREEILAVAQKAIQDLGATGPGDKGKVMRQLVPQLKGKAEGGEINEIVTQLLSHP